MRVRTKFKKGSYVRHIGGVVQRLSNVGVVDSEKSSIDNGYGGKLVYVIFHDGTRYGCYEHLLEPSSQEEQAQEIACHAMGVPFMRKFA